MIILSKCRLLIYVPYILSLWFMETRGISVCQNADNWFTWHYFSVYILFGKLWAVRDITVKIHSLLFSSVNFDVYNISKYVFFYNSKFNVMFSVRGRKKRGGFITETLFFNAFRLCIHRTTVFIIVFGKWLAFSKIISLGANFLLRDISPFFFFH